MSICHEQVNLSNLEAANAWIADSESGFLNDHMIKYLFPGIFTVGVVNNMAFLFTIWRVKRMQTTHNVYLGIQSASDAAFLITTMLMLRNSFNPSPGKQLNTIRDTLRPSLTSCLMKVFPLTICYFISLGCVNIVSIDRFMAVTFPIRYKAMKSKERTVKLVIGNLMVSVCCACVSSLEYIKVQNICMFWPDDDSFTDFPPVRHTCVSISSTTTIAVHMFEIAVFLLSVIANIALYAKIMWTLSHRSVVSSQARVQSVRNQVARLVIVNGILFFLCQFPYRLQIALKLMSLMLPGFKIYERLSFALYIGGAMTMLYSALNTLIYPLMSQFYRHSYREAFSLIACHWRKGSSSGTQSSPVEISTDTDNNI